MDELKEFFDKIIACLDEKQTEEAFTTLKEHIGIVQQYLVFLLNNNIIPEKEVEELSNHIVEAMENRDGLLLDDVIRYALYSIYVQLMEGEVADE